MNTKASSNLYRLFYSLIVMVLVLSSCTRPDPENENVLSPGEMSDVLTDIQLVESTVRVSANDGEFKVDSIDFYSAIFNKHGINREIFEKSMKYYTGNPAQLENIYDEVIVKLSEREAQYQEEKSAE